MQLFFTIVLTRCMTYNEFIRCFHQFVSLIFLSLSSWKRKQTSYWSQTVFFLSSYCPLCNFVANMYVCGKNRENRLLQSKNSSSKSFVPVKFGNVSDAKFGPAHSVILKGNGQVLTSTANKKIEMNFFGSKESKLKRHQSAFPLDTNSLKRAIFYTKRFFNLFLEIS